MNPMAKVHMSSIKSFRRSMKSPEYDPGYIKGIGMFARDITAKTYRRDVLAADPNVKAIEKNSSDITAMAEKLAKLCTKASEEGYYKELYGQKRSKTQLDVAIQTGELVTKIKTLQQSIDKSQDGAPENDKAFSQGL